MILHALVLNSPSDSSPVDNCAGSDAELRAALRGSLLPVEELTNQAMLPTLPTA